MQIKWILNKSSENCEWNFWNWTTTLKRRKNARQKKNVLKRTDQMKRISFFYLKKNKADASQHVTIFLSIPDNKMVI